MNNLIKSISEMSVAELHQAAMECYDFATEISAASGQEAAVDAYREALRHEAEAARRLAPRLDFEPTRSVILRSAATMALKCRDHREAERLVATALSGNPHHEIAEELRDLLEQVNFDRHLGLRGLKLARNEFQISMMGNAIGFDVAESEEFVGRVQVAEKLLIRTIERNLHRPFRDTGKAIRGIAENYQLFLSAPRGGSFAVTLRVGLPDQQLYLEGMEEVAPPTATDTIRDILACFQAFNAGDDAHLTQLIPDPAYRRNFFALARQLAPDGDRVKMVGLTAGDGEPVNRVAIHRLKRDVGRVDADREDQVGVIEVTGGLLFASSTSKSNTIKVVDDENTRHSFYVPEGMMADIVKPLWANRVRVIGARRGKRKVELDSIDAV